MQSRQLVGHFHEESTMNADILMLWCEPTMTTGHVFIKRNKEFPLCSYFQLNGGWFSSTLRFKNDVTDTHSLEASIHGWSLLRPLLTFPSSPAFKHTQVPAAALMSWVSQPSLPNRFLTLMALWQYITIHFIWTNVF